MVACPHCGSLNEADRASCRNCQKPMSGRLAARSRRCRTAAECFQAGWNDGADDPPLTDRQRTQVAALLSRYISPSHSVRPERSVYAPQQAA